jgi:hypothetical protein
MVAPGFKSVVLENRPFCTSGRSLQIVLPPQLERGGRRSAWTADHALVYHRALMVTARIARKSLIDD